MLFISILLFKNHFSSAKVLIVSDMENLFRLKVVKVFQKVINRKTNNVFIPISIYVNKESPAE